MCFGIYHQQPNIQYVEHAHPTQYHVLDLHDQSHLLHHFEYHYIHQRSEYVH